MRQAVRDVVTGRKFTMAINYHTFGSPFHSSANHGLFMVDAEFAEWRRRFPGRAGISIRRTFKILEIGKLQYRCNQK